jgi:hypothetical protein
MSRRSLITGCVCLLVGGSIAWLLNGELESGLLAQPTPVASGGGTWELRVNRVGVNQYDTTRFNRVTGESWQLFGDEWKKVAETGTVPKGDYDIQVAGEEADPGVLVLRIDRSTGKTWRRQSFQWISLADAK